MLQTYCYKYITYISLVDFRGFLKHVYVYVCVCDKLKEQTFTMYIKFHVAVTSLSMSNTESGVSRNLVEASVNQCHSTPLQVPAGPRLPPVASLHRLLPEPEMKMEMKTKEGMKPIPSFLFSLASPAQSLSRQSLSLRFSIVLTYFFHSGLCGCCLSVCFIANCLKACISLFFCLCMHLSISVSIFRL